MSCTSYQSVTVNKHTSIDPFYSGDEVSICLFWNKGIHTNEIPIGSYNKQYAENLRSQTSISNAY